MAANINMKNVQETVEDSGKQARELARKAYLTYLGAWGLSYDFGKSALKDGSEWLNKAEVRGLKVHKQISKIVDDFQSDLPGEVKKVVDSVETNINEVAKDMSGQVEKLGKNMQMYVKQVVGSGPADVVEEIKVNGKAAVKKMEAAGVDVQKAVDSAIDSVWQGYDELSVKDIVSGMEGMSVDTLNEIRSYEVKNKDRVTVLREIDARLQALTS
jgi:hypothetical protein